MRKRRTECVEGAGCGYFDSRDILKVRYSDMVSGWLVICGKNVPEFFFFIRNASES